MIPGDVLILKNLLNLHEKNYTSIPCSGLYRLKWNIIGKTIAYCVLQQIVITRLGIFGQFLFPFQEFRLKNYTLKNGTSRITSYGCPLPTYGCPPLTLPPPPLT